jgi:nucleoside-diphosphate-sugar epimerase
MRALVTGGGGFLGSAIVRRLVERAWEVVSLTRGHYPAVEAMGAVERRGDIGERDVVLGAAEGCDVIFHVAAKAGIWGRDEEYHRANVTGTENVLEACHEHGIPRLVYTSSPSVVHSGSDLEGVDESVPYPEHFEAPYPRTKAAAERMVLAANGSALSTVALRPHLIWGPEDNHLVPKIVARRRVGALKLISGPPKLVDAVYIDNAADAHILALDRLEPGAACAGKAYFISQGEPLPVTELINRILVAAGLSPVEPSIPPAVAFAAGAVLETAYRVLRIPGEPRMTRFLARQLSTAHWFDLSAARRDLGYDPAVSLEEGLDRLRRWFEQQNEPD